MGIGCPISAVYSGVGRAAAGHDEAGVSTAVERGPRGGKLPNPRLVEN